MFYRIHLYRLSTQWIVSILIVVLSIHIRNLYKLPDVSIVIIIFCLYQLLQKYTKELSRCFPKLKLLFKQISKSSYTIYILHQFVINYMIVLLPHNGIYLMVLPVFSFVLAILVPLVFNKIYSSLRDVISIYSQKK